MSKYEKKAIKYGRVKRQFKQCEFGALTTIVKGEDLQFVLNRSGSK